MTAPAPLAWLLAPVVLPHEFAHYLVFAPWRESLTLEIGSGGFDAPDVVLGALAPALLYPLLAGVLDVRFGVSGGSVATGAFVLFSLWAAPSGGDVAVFRHARAVRDAGTLDAGVPADHSRLTETVLTLAVMLVVARVFLA